MTTMATWAAPIALAGAAAAGAAAYGWFITPWRLGVTRVDVPIAGLPPAFDGYVLAVLSDIHHHPGRAVSTRQVRRAVAFANEARPDAVLLLGDYGVSHARDRRPNRDLYRAATAELTSLLRELRAPDGVFAVLGNHDHYAHAGDVRDWMPETGARLLVNEAAVVRRGDASLVLAGVDDATEGDVDLVRALDGAPAGAPVVVLSHHPDAVLRLDPAARADVVFSGHTHGGQVVLPIVGAPMTLSQVCDRDHASGWVPNARAPLYVSRGVGGQIPFRFWCEPEIVVARLRPA